MPRAVTPLSSRYPQLLCVLSRQRRKFSAMTAAPDDPRRRLCACVTVNDPQNAREGENLPRRLSIQNHTVNCAHCGEGPLSAAAAG
jgi:hypothetical protein